MSTLPPTATQLRVLRFIREQRVSRGVPPTIREIGERFGWTSTNAVADFLKQLESKGLLTHERGKGRTLQLTEKGLLWADSFRQKAGAA